MVNMSRLWAGLGFALLAFFLSSLTATAQTSRNLINPNGWFLQDGGAARNLNAYVQNGVLYLSNSGISGWVNGQPGIIVPDFKQSIPTVIGQSYTFQFDVNADGAGDNRLYFDIQDSTNSLDLYTGISLPQQYGVHYSFTERATSSSTALVFAGGAPNSVLYVSNISVTPVPPPSHTHVLWNNTDGRVILWSTAQDGSLTYHVFGPYTDGSPSTPWSAKALATGPDGKSHILWTNPDGRVILWTVDDSGSFTYAAYGPYTDGSPSTPWSAKALSVGADNVVHLLWTNPDHRVILWNVDAAFNFTNAVFGPYDDGSPSTPWNATALATGPDNVTRLVWNNPDGRVILWNVDSAFGFTYHVYGPYNDGSPDTPWSASAVSVGPDGVTHLLWTNPDTRVILWNLDPSFNFTLAAFGPYTDGSASTPWSATALATGPDGLSHLLWTNPDNHVFVWGVDSAFNFTNVLYGPYTDGAPQNIWNATAISAGL